MPQSLLIDRLLRMIVSGLSPLFLLLLVLTLIALNKVLTGTASTGCLLQTRVLPKYFDTLNLTIQVNITFRYCRRYRQKEMEMYIKCKKRLQTMSVYYRKLMVLAVGILLISLNLLLVGGRVLN